MDAERAAGPRLSPTILAALFSIGLMVFLQTAVGQNVDCNKPVVKPEGREETEREVRYRTAYENICQMVIRRGEREANQRERISQLKAGTIKPANCEDIGAIQDASALNRAMLEPSHKVHLLRGGIEQYSSGTMILKFASMDSRLTPFYIWVKTSPSTVWFEREHLAFGSTVLVVGRYMANDQIPLASGGAAPLVMFEASCVSKKS